MYNLVVHTNRKESSYDIVIDHKISLGYYIKKVYKGNKVTIITDDNLYQYYHQYLKSTLEKEGYAVYFIVIKPGEESKSFESLQFIYEKLIDYNMTRSDLILSFGGGVVGDLSGFAASTYLRGIPYIQMPTSLLSMVDSSVGGKTAINIKRGKNLIGSFYNPKLVLIDTSFLNTLPKEYFIDGMGEIIKYAFIDKDLYPILKKYDDLPSLKEDINLIISKCLEIKKRLVEEDFNDQSARMILNFGHTLGHVMEAYYHYQKYTHGVAVGIGMSMITKITEKMGLTKEGTAEKIDELLLKYHLKMDATLSDRNKVRDILQNDKKHINGQLHLIALKDVGDVFIYKIRVEELIERIDEN